MGFLDEVKIQAAELKVKAVDAINDNSDKISVGIDKAGKFVDEQTKGKYSDKIEIGKAKLAAALDKLDDKHGDGDGGRPA